MKSSYWQKRIDELNIRLLDRTEEETMRQVVKLYKKALVDLKKEIKRLYKDIQANSEEGIISVSDLYMYDNYYKLANDLNNKLTTIGESSIELYEKSFVDMYVKTQSILKSTDLKWLKQESDVEPQRIVNEIWASDGKNWSSRVWTNQAQLEDQLLNTLTDCFVKGMGMNQVVRVFAENMGVAIWKARRIVRTELNHIQTQATLDRYKANGITKYQIISVRDDRTCSEECEKLHGKIFDIADAIPGVNLPPIHPNCRCGIAAIIEGIND